MSKENVEVLVNASKTANAATSVEERGGFSRSSTPRLSGSRGRVLPTFRESSTCIKQARQLDAWWASAWEEWGWEIEEAQERGNLVVTRTWVTGRGRESGLVLDMRIGQMWSFRDGKVIRYQTFPTWEQALQAAGLPE